MHLSAIYIIVYNEYNKLKCICESNQACCLVFFIFGLPAVFEEPFFASPCLDATGLDATDLEAVLLESFLCVEASWTLLH